MSIDQPWPISLEAHKSRGVCSSCFAVRQLKNHDDTDHRHGPRYQPFPGSYKLPLSVVTGDPQLAGVPPTQPGHSTGQSTESTHHDDGAFQAADRVHDPGRVPEVSTADAPATANNHRCSPLLGLIIKHIPKLARHACASHLSDLLKAAVSHLEDTRLHG